MAQGSRWSLSDGDVEAIRNEVPTVQYVSGSLRGGTQVVFAENNASTSWQGVQDDWFAINDWQIADGEGFQRHSLVRSDHSSGKQRRFSVSVR